jgi:acyl-coenzyme A thioesterase PaaI-like protein
MGLALVAALRGRGVNVTALLTTHLSLDYIGKAERGWFRITTGVIQAGQSFGLVEATAFADDAVVVHAKASFRAMTAKVD